MKQDQMTMSQALFTIVLFNFGSSVVMGITTKICQDAWIAIILALVPTVPLFFLFGRIMRLFPEKDLFEIMQLLFGKIIGNLLVVLFVWYALHLAALVLRNFSAFTQISSLPETPQLPIMILMALITVYLARSGMRALGKWSTAVIFFVLFVVVFTFAAVAPQLKLDALLPFMEHKPAAVAETAFQVFSFPYAESVMFLGLAAAVQKGDNPYKIFFYALSIIVGVFILVFLRNQALLGATMTELTYFPSYVAVRLLEVGDSLARIEGSISSNFVLAGIVKITVCLLAASRGIAHLFQLEEYRPIVLPVGMLALALCAIVYRSTMEMFAFLRYYPIYAFPFQVAIPVTVWIAGEIYIRRKRREDVRPQANP